MIYNINIHIYICISKRRVAYDRSIGVTCHGTIVIHRPGVVAERTVAFVVVAVAAVVAGISRAVVVAETKVSNVLSFRGAAVWSAAVVWAFHLLLPVVFCPF